MQPELVTSLTSRRYRIERELGRGGMGVVYEAYDVERGARVALKALTHSDALNIYRLKNEFRQLSDISHPNLVSLHELTFDGDQWFFTMELIDGSPFDEYVFANGASKERTDRNLPATMVGRARMLRDPSVTLSQPGIASDFRLPITPCDLTRLRPALTQLAAAIFALHDAGKLHRDIKPSNVLVGDDGRVVVLDFGLVSDTTWVDQNAHEPDKTIADAAFGTPAYMAPEQAVGEPITTASDWYSVGCILFEALTGRLPFEGTVLQILRQKEDQAAPHPSHVVRGIPEDLDDLCSALLRRDPAARPDGAQIMRWLAGSSVPPPLRDTPAENKAELFIGREPHLSMLSAAFGRALAGKMSVVFVHGYSGMGKSALVRCFANDLIRGNQALVLRGRCYERESVPYKAFDDIVDALSSHMKKLSSEEASELLPRNIRSLARLFPMLNRVRAISHARVPLHQTSDPIELRNQAFGAFKDLLLRLCDWQPVVINIDDLQWADMDSARLLSYLLSRPDTPPVLFVGVYRREEAVTSPFMRHVLADPTLNTSETVHLGVGPLQRDEAAQLAEQLLSSSHASDQTKRHAAAVAQESEGVPYFIGELARHMRQFDDPGAPSTAVSLLQVIRTRLMCLTPQAERLLQVLSVAARPIEQGVALEAAQLPTSDRAVFQELRAARMVRTRGTRQTDLAETYHDRVRETVVADLPARRIREIHARVAETSERWGVGEPEQLVVHYAEAGEGGRAGETALQAARAAADKLAFDRAADLYRKALELLPEADQSRRRELQVRLGDALAHAGCGAQAADVYLRAASEHEAGAAGPLTRIAAQQLLASGRCEAGADLTVQLLAQVGCIYPDTRPKLRLAYAWTRSRLAVRGLSYSKRTGALAPETSALLGTLALFREMQGYDVLAAAWLQARFLLAALDAGDEEALLEALSWEGFHLSSQRLGAHEKRAQAVIDLACRVAHKINTPYAHAKYQAGLAAFLLFVKGQYRDAYEAACAGDSLLQGHHQAHNWEHTWLTSLKYVSLEFAGDLSTLVNCVPQSARDLASRDDRLSLALLLHAVPLTHLIQNEPEAADAFIQAQAKKLGGGCYSGHVLVMIRGADVLLYQGRGAEAWAWVRRHWQSLARNLVFHNRMLRASAHLVRARAALLAYQELGDRTLLAWILRDSVALRQLGPGYAGFAPTLEAQVAVLKGDLGLARARFEAALQLFSKEQSDHAVHYVRYRLGQLLGDMGGQAMERAAREALERQGVKDVERFVQVAIPIGSRDTRA
ncbi:MAG: AAA family ATPase [Polyangiales bacterium]